MIGEKLSALLDSRNIKAGTLASRTGIPKSTIYSIIKRNNKNVDYSVIEQIAAAMDVDVEYFYEAKTETPRVTARERDFLDAYNSLDRYGQDAVRAVMAVERSRMIDIARRQLEEENGKE